MNKRIIDPMSQKFGIEIEMTGITRKQACDILVNEFDMMEIEPNRKSARMPNFSLEDAKQRTWEIWLDKSIQPAERYRYKECDTYSDREKNDFCVELITPPLNYNEGEYLKYILDRFKEQGAKVNQNCGIHIHVDGARHNRVSLLNLLNIFYNMQDLIYESLEIDETREEISCAKIDKDLIDMIDNRTPNSFGAIILDWYNSYYRQEGAPELTFKKDMNGFCDLLWHMYDQKDSSRNYGLNLHAFFHRGAVEFRLFNGTLDYKTIKAYVDFCLAMSAQSINYTDWEMKQFIGSFNNALSITKSGYVSPIVRAKEEKKTMKKWLKTIHTPEESIQILTKGLDRRIRKLREEEKFIYNFV